MVKTIVATTIAMDIITTTTIKMLSGPSVDTPLTNCTLCPRTCGVNRWSGNAGICGVSGYGVRLARAALHEWEEPCISVNAGSGAVFFSGCPLHCVYCQNAAISDGTAGKDVDVSRLAHIFVELQDADAANINLVTPTHYVPQIIEAIDQARSMGMNLPIVYNTSGYEKPETLNLIKGIVDVYLTDFKYMDTTLAAAYSKAPDYPDVALQALKVMVDQVGSPVYNTDEQGNSVLVKGVVVRHLLLPGCLDDSKRIVSYLAAEYGNTIAVSLMNQYTPMPGAGAYGELARRVTDGEYEQLLDYADDVGLADYYWQQGGAAQDSFIPPFDCSGV